MIVCSHRRNNFVVLPSGHFHSFQIYDTAMFCLPVVENVSNQVVGQIKYLFYEISQKSTDTEENSDSTVFVEPLPQHGVILVFMGITLTLRYLLSDLVQPYYFLLEKSDFVRDASHLIRTHLTAVNIWVHYMNHYQRLRGHYRITGSYWFILQRFISVSDILISWINCSTECSFRWMVFVCHHSRIFSSFYLLLFWKLSIWCDKSLGN